MRVRFAVARHQGFDEDQASLVDDDYEQSALDERQKDVLRLADRFTDRPGEAPTTLTIPEQVALLLSLVQVRFSSRVLLTLGIEDRPEAPAIREVAGRS
jgi:hypothetical protein